MVINTRALFYTLALIPTLGFSKVNITKLKDQLANKSNRLSKLGAQIKDFDKRIGTTNNDFLKKIKDIEETEVKIKEFKTELTQSGNEISKEYKLVQLAFDYYLLESHDSVMGEDLKKKTIHHEVLLKKLNSLKEAQNKSDRYLKSINHYEQILSEKKKEEQEIYTLIVELENRKREMSQQYVTELEKKNQLQGKVDKFVAKVKAKRKRRPNKRSKKYAKVDFNFLVPITNFVDAVKKKRGGIDFKFSETTPIKSPGSGKVVYVGELASYGKVMIIDHGKDVRSVLFGDIVSKVKKNGMVKQGDILGYTMGDPGVMKSVYYEVRKNNKVQNTLQWLNQKQRKSIKI